MRTIFPKWPPLFICFVWTLVIVSLTLFCLRKILSTDDEAEERHLFPIIPPDPDAAASASAAAAAANNSNAQSMTSVNARQSSPLMLPLSRPLPLKLLRGGIEHEKPILHSSSVDGEKLTRGGRGERDPGDLGWANCDNSNRPRSQQRHQRSNESTRQPMQRTLEYCNDAESASVNNQSEGFADDDDEYQISGVAMVMRHGYRSPMYMLPTLPSPGLCCNSDWLRDSELNSTHNNSSFRQFLYASRQFLGNKTSPPPRIFRRFGLYPHSENCYGAQLTVQGTIQMLNLGHYFRSRYVGADKLMPETESGSMLYLRTTEYTRTFQSAIAFVYGFLETTDFRSIQVETARNLFFCPDVSDRNVSCSCPTANRLAKSIEAAIKSGASATEGGGRENEGNDRRLREGLVRVFNVSSNRLPNNGILLEVFMSGICHGFDPPCPLTPPTGSRLTTRDCVTWDMVNDIWRQLDNNGRQRSQRDDNRLLGRLLSYPLLHEILNNFISISRGELKRVFSLYSGHDKTLTTLADGLGVGDGRWPPFGSRFVFELLRHRTNRNRFFVRILYNGNDVTERIKEDIEVGEGTKEKKASKELSPNGRWIPLESFTDFIVNSSFQRTGKTGYANACADI